MSQFASRGAFTSNRVDWRGPGMELAVRWHDLSRHASHVWPAYVSRGADVPASSHARRCSSTAVNELSDWYC